MSKAKYCVFDVESTGIDTHVERVVQMFLAFTDADGNILDDQEWIIYPGMEVPEEAAAVHGFTTEYLRERGMDPRDAFGYITEWFEEAIENDLIFVAFNMNYDLSILDAEIARHLGIKDYGLSIKNRAQLFDPLVVDRAKDKYRKGKRKLEFMAAHYGVDFDPEKAHKADYDVEITARVAAKVAEKFGIPSNRDQAVMFRTWAENFQDYLRRTDKKAIVESSWPLRLKPEPKEET